MTGAAPVPPDLLAHAAFVRRLARSLVGDAHAADDVVQEAWRRGIERPPVGDARSWLARVTRHLAWQRRRGDARRAERERRAARAEAVEVESGPERAEVLQRVVDAVRALDEPYRATVLARFYEDLPPRAIARRDGVSVDTVNARLRRGLARLRAELARERREWRGALGLLAGESPCATQEAARGIVAMKNAWIVSGMVVIAGFGTWLSLSRREPRQGSSASGAPGVSRTGELRPAAAALLDPPAPPARAALPPTATEPAAPEPDIVRGQVVDGGDLPVGGALVFFGEEARVRGDEPFKPVRPEPVEDAARTAADGTFELRGTGPFVTAVHPDFCVSTVPLEQAGRIVLAALGSIHGTLLDVDGRPAVEALVYLGNPSDDSGSSVAARTDSSGAFSFERVGAGAHALWRDVGTEDGELLLCVRLAPAASIDVEVQIGALAPPELDLSALAPEETELDGVLVGLDELAGLAWIDRGTVHGGVQPGRYWLATRQGIAGPLVLEPGAPPARIEPGPATLAVRSERRVNVQVAPPDADAFTRLMAARPWVKAEGATEARFRLAPGRYLLVGHAGTVLREVELPPEGMLVELE